MEAQLPRFDFAAPTSIAFGLGRVSEAGAAAAVLLSGHPGGRVFAIGGSDPSRLAPLAASLEAADLEYTRYALSGEPTFERLREAVEAARGAGCRLVVGFGGGSAIDLAKAVAALLANPGDPLDYAEVIGGGRPLSEPSLPCIAIPTTSGTGAEATKNAVIKSVEKAVKVSLRSPTMLPRLAIVDPELSYSLPPEATAQTGMDALTQLIEPLVCCSPNPLVDALCREALPRAIRSLPRAYRDGCDAEARSDMAFASLSSGLALANARLGAVHGIAGPLGGQLPISHGAACAALLAPAAAVNVSALRERSPSSPALARYAEVASILRGGRSSRPEDAAEALAELAISLGIRGLKDYGLESRLFPSLAEKAAASSSMRGNPLALRSEEIEKILSMAAG